MESQIKEAIKSRLQNINCYSTNSSSRRLFLDMESKQIVCKTCYEKFVKDPFSIFEDKYKLHVVAEERYKIKTNCNICKRRLLEVQCAGHCELCIEAYHVYGEKLFTPGEVSCVRVYDECPECEQDQ